MKSEINQYKDLMQLLQSYLITKTKSKFYKNTHHHINIYAYEDFSKEKRTIRKPLQDKVKKLRRQEKYSLIKYDKIYSSELHTRRYTLFSTQPQCCFTFPWIQLQMFLRCCLLHITIILWHILYLIYLYPYLGLGLFMPSLCDPFFILSLILIIINHTISL